MWDLFHSIFPLISISNCRICPPTFPGCGSLGLWLHPHHVHKDFGKGKFEMEMKMNMSNDWWNMQRVRHPTTSKLPLHRRVCHNFSWGCGEKEKILTSILLFFRIFMKVKFLVAGWLWPRGLGQLTNPVGVDPSYQQATIQATGCCAWRWWWRWWINKQSKQLQQHVSPSPLFFHPPTLCCSICFVSISISCLVSLCVSAVSVGHLTTMSVNGQMKVFGVGSMKRGAMWCGDCGCHS